MCVQVTKTANRFEISSLLENILLKQVRGCLTLVGLYILISGLSPGLHQHKLISHVSLYCAKYYLYLYMCYF